MKSISQPAPQDARVILRAFEEPDEVHMMEKGRYEVVRIGGQVFGRATYEPGWRWSEHVGASVGARCGVEHLGLVLAGRATAAFDDGMITELRQGQILYFPPVPHDSWVAGDEPCELHFLGADRYAKVTG
jgi:hypothetical protein